MPRRFFRIAKNDPATIDDFRSGASLGKPLHSTDPEAVRTHDGVSMWDERRLARKKARLSPALGRYIVDVTIPDDTSIRFERTFGFGHYTVWGEPNVLATLVTSISPVNED